MIPALTLLLLRDESSLTDFDSMTAAHFGIPAWTALSVCQVRPPTMGVALVLIPYFHITKGYYQA